MYIFDTDILSHYLRGRPEVLKRHEASGQARPRTSIVSQAEVLQGWIQYLLKADSKTGFLKAQWLFKNALSHLTDFDVVDLSEDSLAVFEDLSSQKKTKSVGRADLLIGSVALASEATLVTVNEKDFCRIPGLRLENWLA